MKSLKNKKGFTIVELVIVIAVIAILAAVMIPTFSNIVTRANESKALQEAKNAYTQAMIDNNDNDKTNDVAGIDEEIFVEINGIKVKIENGSASLWKSENNNAFTATHSYANGKLTKMNTDS